MSKTPTIPDWRNASPMKEPHYPFWVDALTGEKLHDKADIALLLAMLTRELAAAQESLAESNWSLKAAQNWIKFYQEFIADLKKQLAAAQEAYSRAKDITKDMSLRWKQEHEEMEAENAALRGALREIAKGRMPEDYGKFGACVARLSDTAIHALNETYYCPIHGNLGGINECPRC